MADIFILVEHRQDEIRDITYELMSAGRYLANQQNSRLTAIILGNNTEKYIEQIKTQVHRIINIDSPIYKNFNAESYQIALANIINRENPFLTLIGHTAFGMDLCPSLATELEIPFTTDCLEIKIKNKDLFVTRQIYDGKLDAKVKLRKDSSYILSLRSGCFPAAEADLKSMVENLDSPLTAEKDYRRFVEYIEAAKGDIDITQSDIVVGVGRGIKEKDNIPIIKDFAETIGGVLGCSRPIVDADWLPKDRQVGSSGKTIKPKLYIALGISGAFQHVMGMKSADTIVAVNKDPNAPIFNEADYGIVDDLFKVVPVLKNKILEIKG